MKKILLSFAILLFALTVNGCVEKSIVPDKNLQTTQRATTPIPVDPSPSRTTTPTPPNSTPTREISVAPSTDGEQHQLQSIQGSIITVQERSNGFVFPQYEDKIILLQIFGYDCPSCFKEMPIITRIQQRYAGSLQVLAIQAQNDMTKQTASHLIQKFQINYPIIDKDEAIGLLYFMQKTYGWMGVLPYILIIKNGVTEYSYSGEVSHKELDEAVRSLI